MSVTRMAGKVLHLRERLLAWDVPELPGETLSNEAGR